MDDRIALLKKLSDERFEHFQAMGLPPFKCRQLVAEKADEWEKLPTERLQQLVEEPEPEY